MNTGTVDHGSFTVERTYPVTRQHVFGAWSSRAAKNRWFGEGDDFLASTEEYTLDFRVGGRERLAGVMPGGRRFAYDAVNHDIVDDRRIIVSYDVAVDGRRASISLMIVELHDVPDGTRLSITEHGAFLDGLDSNDQRQEGAVDSLDQLGAFLTTRVSA